ncbi:MAG: hypothetical protein KBB91_01095 [Candidatus Pacebacteria bacterium]|jgi:hypothetical protein|nr:hypothetical protein [Candidatus Paceibacterota bacterium]MBP9700973.1 hypothetical protein [Candidatus Paceibacterota bacterium]
MENKRSVYKKHGATSLDEIKRRRLTNIYFAKRRVLVESIIDLCLSASLQELKIVLDRLGSRAGELGNILSNERPDRFRTGLRVGESYVLFRDGLRITKIDWHEFTTESLDISPVSEQDVAEGGVFKSLLQVYGLEYVDVSAVSIAE